VPRARGTAWSSGATRSAPLRARHPFSFLEGEFGIRVADADTTPENLESIERMIHFVERKRRSAA
jgi:hypothetical protein